MGEVGFKNFEWQKKRKEGKNWTKKKKKIFFFLSFSRALTKKSKKNLQLLLQQIEILLKNFMKKKN